MSLVLQCEAALLTQLSILAKYRRLDQPVKNQLFNLSFYLSIMAKGRNTVSLELKRILTTVIYTDAALM